MGKNGEKPANLPPAYYYRAEVSKLMLNRGNLCSYSFLD